MKPIREKLNVMQKKRQEASQKQRQRKVRGDAQQEKSACKIKATKKPVQGNVIAKVKVTARRKPNVRQEIKTKQGRRPERHYGRKDKGLA